MGNFPKGTWCVITELKQNNGVDTRGEQKRKQSLNSMKGDAKFWWFFFFFRYYKTHIVGNV